MKRPTTTDAKGVPLNAGDTVRAVEWGEKAIKRLVKAIGCGEQTTGYIEVEGKLGWHSAKQFEKVT